MRTAPRILIATVAIALTLGPARAQATPEADAKGYPNRAIRIIVPSFRAGRRTPSHASSGSA
jgi:hypothetical protein